MYFEALNQMYICLREQKCSHCMNYNVTIKMLQINIQYIYNRIIPCTGESILMHGNKLKLNRTIEIGIEIICALLCTYVYVCLCVGAHIKRALVAAQWRSVASVESIILINLKYALGVK